MLISATKKKTVTFDLRCVSYLGVRLWNDSPVHIGKLSDDHMMMQIPDFINDTYVLRLTFKSQMSMALYVFALYVYFDAFLA